MAGTRPGMTTQCRVVGLRQLRARQREVLAKRLEHLGDDALGVQPGLGVHDGGVVVGSGRASGGPCQGPSTPWATMPLAPTRAWAYRGGGLWWPTNRGGRIMLRFRGPGSTPRGWDSVCMPGAATPPMAPSSIVT